jgi:hypothetical protein
MKCKCAPGGQQFPLHGEGFSRRNFLRVAGTGLVASYFADVFDPRLLLAQTASSNVPLLNTAQSVIFIFLQGAPSQVDMWDLKEGAWTPADLAPTSYGDVRWPQGILPKTAEHLSKLSIVRCGLAWAAVHQLAQRWVQITRNPGGATGAIAPLLGAVVSLETQASRAIADVLPGVIARYSGAVSDVAEGSVMVVTIKAVVERGVGLDHRWQFRAVGKENIQKAVIVEIEDRDSAQHRIDYRLVRQGAVVEHESDT